MKSAVPQLLFAATLAILTGASVLSGHPTITGSEAVTLAEIKAIGQEDLGDPIAIRELRNLVRMWDGADVKGDAATLDRLLADEFTFVGGPNKAQYLASIKSKSADTYVESAISDDVQVQVYGTTAIVTGLDIVKGKNGGQSYENKYLYMDVWVKRSGRWQCVKTYSTLSRKN